MKRLTPETITDPDKMLADLEKYNSKAGAFRRESTLIPYLGSVYLFLTVKRSHCLFNHCWSYLS